MGFAWREAEPGYILKHCCMSSMHNHCKRAESSGTREVSVCNVALQD